MVSGRRNDCPKGIGKNEEKGGKTPPKEIG
jgi:hypothetical protein